MQEEIADPEGYCMLKIEKIEPVHGCLRQCIASGHIKAERAEELKNKYVFFLFFLSFIQSLSKCLKRNQSCTGTCNETRLILLGLLTELRFEDLREALRKKFMMERKLVAESSELVLERQVMPILTSSVSL